MIKVTKHVWANETFYDIETKAGCIIVGIAEARDLITQLTEILPPKPAIVSRKTLATY
jgi:hypothetical protein